MSPRPPGNDAMRLSPFGWVLAVCCLVCPRAAGQHIDLATLPARSATQLTIYNAADLTLVREARVMTFSQGLNTLEFSWADTLIDPTSVRVAFITRGEELVLIDTVYPHDRPEELRWQIDSGFDGEAVVEVTYFISGISWSADYTVIADATETQAAVTGFVTVNNQSGEDYENAQVRVVVGRINLVERIIDLARQGRLRLELELGRVAGREIRREVLGESLTRVQDGEALFQADSVGNFSGVRTVEPETAPVIIREGLSEYFIFTVAGTQDVPNGWAKRLHSFTAEAAPLEVVYRHRVRQYGEGLMKMYLLTNDEASGMGASPLPNGQVRVFRENERGGLIYLMERALPYVAVTDDLEINLGYDPNVVFDMVQLEARHEDIWMRRHGEDVLVEVAGEGVRIEPRDRVVGYTQRVMSERIVRNYTGREIQLEVRRVLEGDVTFTAAFEVSLYEADTVAYEATVPAGETMVFRRVTQQRRGTNEEQQRVVIEQGDPGRASWE